MVIYSGLEQADIVAVTFDDGPNPKITPRILKVLEHQGVKATFFLTGKGAEKYPDIVRQIISNGHDVGNHTYTHKPLASLCRNEGEQAVKEEIKNGLEAIKRIAGISEKELQFFRPPYLDWNSKVGGIAKPFYRDRIVMSWLGSNDFSWGDGNHYWDENDIAGINYKAEEIIYDVGSNTVPGSIITLHDSAEYGIAGNIYYPTWMNRAIPTLRALPMIIDNLHKKNLKIKKLSEMSLRREPIRVQ